MFAGVVCAALISACGGGSAKTGATASVFKTTDASTTSAGSVTPGPSAAPSTATTPGASASPLASGPPKIEIVLSGVEQIPLDPQRTFEFTVVAKGVAPPGFTIYQVVIDYDETALDMVELQDAAFIDANPRPLCIAMSDTDYNGDGNLMAELDCAVPGASDPQNPDDGKARSGDVTLGRFKFEPLKSGVTPLLLVTANLRTAHRQLLKLALGQGYSIQVGGNP